MDCASRSSDARKALDSIEQVIGVALAGGKSAGDENFGKNLLEDLNRRVADLQAASASSADANAKVAAQAEALRAGLKEAGDGLRIGGLFAEIVNRCCDRLDRLAAQSRSPEGSGEPTIEVTPEARYTMESERSVHRASLGGMADGASEAVPDESAQEVEFF